MSKPTLSIFSGAKGLGTIFSEQNQINVKMQGSTVPFTTTSGNATVNLGGKIRIIVVQGAHDGTGFDGTTQEQKLGDFIYEMEQWINAGTQTAKRYTDSFGEEYLVMCTDWTWTRSFKDPNRILYSLLMKETLVQL